MSVEDKKLTRELMRELGRRRALDITDTRMSVARGVAYVGGIIRPSPGELVDPKAEIRTLTENIRKIPGMRDVVIDAKFEISTKR